MTDPTNCEECELGVLPVASLKDGVMLDWRIECYRSAATAITFTVPLVLLQRTRGDGVFAKAKGYIENSISTFALLLRNRPSTVICTNLPAFLPMICGIYGLLSGSRIILDFHSGALTKRRWRLFLFLYKLLVRKAPFTLCHNHKDSAEIASWGGRPLDLFTLPQVKFDRLSYSAPTGRPQFLFACSFASDEPIDIALTAMQGCPDFNFIISGDYRKIKLDPAKLPSNIRLSGFLEYQEYLEIMAGSTAVLTLSTRSHIMQMAVEEALTIGTPVITNGAKTLREVLGKGGVYCEIDQAAVIQAFHTCVANHADLVCGMVRAKVGVFAANRKRLVNIKTKYPEMFRAD